MMPGIEEHSSFKTAKTFRVKEDIKAEDMTSKVSYGS